jgi:tripartite ATP-independent transporter DctM subunit
MLDPFVVGLLGLFLLLILLILGVPVAFSLLISGFIGNIILIGFSDAINILGTSPYQACSSYIFVVLPMFLLMGEFIGISGIASELFKSGSAWLGRLPGGLAMATTGGCALFSAASGSSIGTTSLFGKVALPEMERMGYDKQLSSGCVAASGSLAALIPPSGAMVIYSIFTMSSLGDLMLAGFIPGAVSALIYMGIIYIIVRLKPRMAPSTLTHVSWKERFIALKWVLPIITIVVIILGGIYTGIFTPTEAGAIGCFCTLIMALIRKSLGKGRLHTAIMGTGQTCVMILLIIIAALVYSRFLALTGLPRSFADYMMYSNLSSATIVIVFLFVYLVLGCFIPSGAIIPLLLPLFLPTLESAGVNLIWFGILCIKLGEIAVITPPLGLNVYALKGAVGESIEMTTIFKGIFPFLLMDILTVVILFAFPSISLWLPQTAS